MKAPVMLPSFMMINCNLGTTNGLYTVPLTAMDDLSFVKGQFMPVPNTKGQVWGLSEINGHVLLGHHDGSFQVTPQGAIPVNAKPGWGYGPTCPSIKYCLPHRYWPVPIMGWKYWNTGRMFSYRLPGKRADEPARFITFDNNNIAWASHPYRGVYRVDIERTACPHQTVHR